MKQIYPDLWQTTAETHGRLTTYAYLLVRESGNVLLYSSGNSEDHDQIEGLGGITHQFLSHRDEVGPPLAQIKERFGAQLCCHALETHAVVKAASVDVEFTERGMHLGDIEVIPTPGHTDGSTSYLYRSPHGASYLFTGDSIIPKPDGSWGTIVQSNAGGSAAATRSSLNLFRDLEPDAICASGVRIGSLSFHEMAPGEWRDAVDQALSSLTVS